MRYLIILLLLASCKKPCYERIVLVARFTAEYECHQVVTEYRNRIEICGHDTTIINCLESKQTIYKPCYKVQSK